MSKSKLNELCQKNRWGSPMYSYIKDGKEHSPLFRGSVVVNGHTFVSQSFFKSSKSAYNDVAQQALNNFTTFTLSTVDMANTKRQKVSIMSSSDSHSDNDVPIKTNEFDSPALEEDKTTTASIPTTVLPKGSAAIPIDDDLWTIVSSEPN